MNKLGIKEESRTFSIKRKYYPDPEDKSVYILSGLDINLYNNSTQVRCNYYSSHVNKEGVSDNLVTGKITTDLNRTCGVADIVTFIGRYFEGGKLI